MSVRQFYRIGESPNPEPLHYTASGLDNVYLSNGFSVEVDEDGDRCTAITDLDGLHRAIALHIVLQRKAPSGRELRFLREELRMSQVELAARFDISSQTVARWEKGESEPSGTSLFALRTLCVFMLAPLRQRQALLDGLLDRLRDLSESNDVTGEVCLAYIGDEWREPSLAA